MHFYQVAMERQTIAAQLEAQLSYAELENLKSQLRRGPNRGLLPK
jgi:hypothetical protein